MDGGYGQLQVLLEGMLLEESGHYLVAGFIRCSVGNFNRQIPTEQWKA